MGHIIALTNSKGGVGKSTVAVHLAAWCAGQGRRTALVDADAQGASSLWLHEAAPDVTVSRLQTPDENTDEWVARNKDGISGGIELDFVGGGYPALFRQFVAESRF